MEFQIDDKYIGTHCSIYFVKNKNHIDDLITGDICIDQQTWTDKLNLCKEKSKLNPKIINKKMYQYRDLCMEIVSPVRESLAEKSEIEVLDFSAKQGNGDKINYYQKEYIDTIINNKVIISYEKQQKIESYKFPIIYEYHNISNREYNTFIANDIEINFIRENNESLDNKLNESNDMDTKRCMNLNYINLQFTVDSKSNNDLKSILNILRM